VHKDVGATLCIPFRRDVQHLRKRGQARPIVKQNTVAPTPRRAKVVSFVHLGEGGVAVAWSVVCLQRTSLSLAEGAVNA
jgi:hypothetical protein